MALINKLEAVGDVIRTKTGKTDKLTLDEMVNEIEGIQVNDKDELPLDPEKLTEQVSFDYPIVFGAGFYAGFYGGNGSITSSLKTKTSLKETDAYKTVTKIRFQDISSRRLMGADGWSTYWGIKGSSTDETRLDYAGYPTDKAIKANVWYEITFECSVENGVRIWVDGEEWTVTPKPFTSRTAGCYNQWFGILDNSFLMQKADIAWQKVYVNNQLVEFLVPCAISVKKTSAEQNSLNGQFTFLDLVSHTILNTTTTRCATTTLSFSKI